MHCNFSVLTSLPQIGKTSGIKNFFKVREKIVDLVKELMKLSQVIDIDSLFSGELYDIGWKQKMFMGCSGCGPLTIILDAPTSKSSDAWALIAPQVSKVARVCVYDRAGLGFSDRPLVNWSDPEQSKRGRLSTSERMVEDFHRLFTLSSEQPKPFILVGAELGAVNARFYTQIFENDVASLVLINPLTEGMFDEEWTKLWYERYVSAQQALQFSAATGITRIALMLGFMNVSMQHKLLPFNVTIRQKYLLCKPGHLSAGVDEFYFANESLAQMRMVRKLKPFPQSADVSIISSSLYDDKLNRKLDQVRIVGIHIVTVQIVLLAFFLLVRHEFIYFMIFFIFKAPLFR